MHSRIITAIGILGLVLTMGVSTGMAGNKLTKCFLQNRPPSCERQDRSRQGPTCGIELTCTDKPVQLGYGDGVCFRASCPGIWALMHKRADQASFRRRIFTYRHYRFAGYWELKDQGAIESGASPLRELFLVLPDDLIEFKLKDPDVYAAVEVRNLGYIKKGSVKELKAWLAYNIYLERPDMEQGNGASRTSCPKRTVPGGGLRDWLNTGVIGGLFSVGRYLCYPFFNQ